MNKPIDRKLKLRRETLRELTKAELNELLSRIYASRLARAAV
jgi:hypothetical protein